MTDSVAYWAVAAGVGQLRPQYLREPQHGEVLVRALYSGVSRGTEALVVLGRVPPSQWSAMRAPFQEGSFPFPVKYGYSSVGVVEAGPEDLVGRQVFCLFPHQTRYVVTRDAVVPLPERLPAARAVLAANMETALNAVWDGAAAPGQKIHVIGAGVVGSLVAYLCGRMPGADVTLADIAPERSALAEALGVAFASPETLPEDADLVFHASGSPDGLRTALHLVGVEGRIVELSWYGSAAVTLPLGENFHSRRLTLLASQVGTVAPAMRPRWTRARRLAKALELLRDPALDLLVSGEATFAELPALLPRLAANPEGALCLRIVYPNES
ncbi:MAG: zinc-binding alcohol dehydrogenase [Geminicoccaceae bacterium]